MVLFLMEWLKNLNIDNEICNKELMTNKKYPFPSGDFFKKKVEAVLPDFPKWREGSIHTCFYTSARIGKRLVVITDWCH